jgi:hypothetical protein
MPRRRTARKEEPMRTVIASLLLAMTLTGCNDWSWSVSINTSASVNPVYTSDQVGLFAVITTDHTSISVVSQSWTMASAPGTYTLTDQGSSAQAVFFSPGTYVVRYSVTYWADDGYRYSQSSLLYMTVLAPVPG